MATRLNAIFAAHLAHTPEWEVKCALSLHLWLDAEHSAALRRRVGEMREPPLHLDQVPEARLQAWLEEVLRARSTVELLIGVYRVVKPALIEALTRHLAEMNPLADHPTRRTLTLILREQQEMVAWGAQALAALTRRAEAAAEAASWEQHLQAYLAAAGGIAGPALPEGPRLPAPRADGRPYEMDAVPQRDGRFHDSFNSSARIDEYYADEARPLDERVYALLYKRLREMDVPEWMAPIIYKAHGKPWDYYADLSRQLWDEARHAMLGEVGLYRDGMPFYAYPLDLKSSQSLNTQMSPLEAHLVLWHIEQGLMPHTGKRREFNIAQEANDPLATVFQDFDWADEVLHAQIGRRWLASEFGSPEEMRAAAETARANWTQTWETLRPLSAQQEWWPAFLADIRHRRELRRQTPA